MTLCRCLLALGIVVAIAMAEDVQSEELQAPLPSARPEDLTESARRVPQLEVEIGKAEKDYKAPRLKFIGIRTDEYRFALYVDNWKNKVERVAMLNYPDAARGKLYGAAVVAVEIASDGAVRSVKIYRSSGHKILDDAIKRIVMMASPYAPFPPEIRHDTDIIVITRSWTFVSDEKARSLQDEKATPLRAE